MASNTPAALLPYRDIPTTQEIFADSMELLSFNGQCAHLTLTVTRLEESAPGEEKKGGRYTAARLAMTPELLTTLYNKMSQMVHALEEQGIVKRNATDKIPESPMDVN